MSAPREVPAGPVSWAAATWSVPAAIVTWLLISLLVGVAVDPGENMLYVIAAVTAVAIAGGGAVIARHGGPAIRGIGIGLMYASLASMLFVIVAIAQ